MYHYIRDIDKKYPYLNILKKKNFLSQIKKFLKLGIIKSYDEIFVEIFLGLLINFILFFLATLIIFFESVET